MSLTFSSWWDNASWRHVVKVREDGYDVGTLKLSPEGYAALVSVAARVAESDDITVAEVLAACDWYGIGRTVHRAIETFRREQPTEGDDE